MEADPGARAFYEGAAAAAAALGVRVDVFAACAGPCGLDAVEPLAAGSGGALLHYPHLEQAALPQVPPMQAPRNPCLLILANVFIFNTLAFLARACWEVEQRSCVICSHAHAKNAFCAC